MRLWVIPVLRLHGEDDWWTDGRNDGNRDGRPREPEGGWMGWRRQVGKVCFFGREIVGRRVWETDTAQDPSARSALAWGRANHPFSTLLPRLLPVPPLTKPGLHHLGEPPVGTLDPSSIPLFGPTVPCGAFVSVVDEHRKHYASTSSRQSRPSHLSRHETGRHILLLTNQENYLYLLHALSWCLFLLPPWSPNLRHMTIYT